MSKSVVNAAANAIVSANMPPKGQKARRGGKSPGAAKIPAKKKVPENQPPSELDESLRPEGAGKDVDFVILYNMETEKFQYYPSKGQAGTSLLAATGIDVSQPMSREIRMKQVNVKIAANVSYKSKIFLRFEKGTWSASWSTITLAFNVMCSIGNETEMQKASVALLNSELESYDTPEEKLERYEDLLDLYKEFVKDGFMIRRRRNTRQPFPEQPRNKRGTEIMFASVRISNVLVDHYDVNVVYFPGHLHVRQQQVAREVTQPFRGFRQKSFVRVSQKRSRD